MLECASKERVSWCSKQNSVLGSNPNYSRIHLLTLKIVLQWKYLIRFLVI